ncbi:hypothetical protein [Mesorhizobium sp. YM1C-6-2]|uniref:hypothetical protein n=1 Tax=Mesorhizobium sp. YM1C-6-2 TaxID=1827501 RepID=UPI000EF2127B|nr:hypothetical protein [Mesorhizobium sp. YM1C-6-2]RLP22749.1 hypothetical protein D8676_22725 [Mesorhizobium sp. YM1C-6-2]
MYLVEVFVPLDRGDGSPVHHHEIRALVRRLADRFGGATAFSRAPAQGLWKESDGISQDRIVIAEVMVDTLDRSWWTAFKEELERDLQQEQIVVRCATCEVL